MKALNASVHHEILSPIKVQIETCKYLLSHKDKNDDERHLITIILFSSQFMKMHAQDFLD